MDLKQLTEKLDKIERESLEQWIPVLKRNFGFSEQKAWKMLQGFLTIEAEERYKKMGLEV